MQLLTFLHVAGIIIALGAVTVIDVHGFLSRKSKEWTQITIGAHHVTKPLIWIGTTLMICTWPFIVSVWNKVTMIKSALMIVLVLNGAFLSFYVSPILDTYKGKKQLFPISLQIKTITSAVISFAAWWSLVWITVQMI